MTEVGASVGIIVRLQDWLISLNDEWQLMWKAKWTLGKSDMIIWSLKQNQTLVSFQGRGYTFFSGIFRDLTPETDHIQKYPIDDPDTGPLPWEPVSLRPLLDARNTKLTSIVASHFLLCAPFYPKLCTFVRLVILRLLLQFTNCVCRLHGANRPDQMRTFSGM